MRSIIINFLLTVFLISSVEAAPRTYAEILKSKEIRMCYVAWLGKDTLPEFPSPYLDIGIAFAKKKSLKPIVEKILWDDQFKNNEGKVIQGATYDPAIFESKKCDFIAGNISPVEWRKKLMDLNWVYISNMMVLVRKEDKKKFKKVSDLKGKTVTVIPGTTYYDWLMDFQKGLKESEKVKIIEVASGGTVSFLLNKQSDFIILSSHQAMYTKLHISPEVSIAFTVGEPMESGWGFPKGSEDLRLETVKFFESQKTFPDSEVNEIYKKYFGMTLSEYEKLQHTLIQ